MIVRVGPDGSLAVSGLPDQTLKVWNLHTGACLATYNAEAAIRGVAVSADGLDVVAGDEGGGVHFLRLENLRPIT